MDTFLEVFMAVSTSAALTQRERDAALHALECVLLDDKDASENRHRILRSLLGQVSASVAEIIPPVKPIVSDDDDAVVAALAVIGVDLEFTPPNDEFPFGMFAIIE